MLVTNGQRAVRVFGVEICCDSTDISSGVIFYRPGDIRICCRTFNTGFDTIPVLTTYAFCDEDKNTLPMRCYQSSYVTGCFIIAQHLRQNMNKSRFSSAISRKTLHETRVWSGSYFIFITNRGRLPKWHLPFSLVFPSHSLLILFTCITEGLLVFKYRLLRSSLPSYLYSLL